MCRACPNARTDRFGLCLPNLRHFRSCLFLCLRVATVQTLVLPERLPRLETHLHHHRERLVLLAPTLRARLRLLLPRPLEQAHQSVVQLLGPAVTAFGGESTENPTQRSPSTDAVTETRDLVAVVQLTVEAAVAQSSYSAYSATTVNPTSNWATGTVALTDDDDRRICTARLTCQVVRRSPAQQ